MQRIYLIYLHSFYNARINYTCIVHLIGLSHVIRALPLNQESNIWLKLLAHSSSFTLVCSAGTVYSGPNYLDGIVGLDKLSMIGIGLVAAFVVIAITYATAYRSGAAINPAVTIGLLVTGKIRAKVAALYIACQILGAVIGAAVVYSMFGSDMAASLTLPADNNVSRALILETIMTFTLVYVILTTLHHNKNSIADCCRNSGDRTYHWI